MKVINRWLALLVIIFLLQLSCKKEYSCENCIVGKAPIANAGLDLVIELPVDSILLDGAGSNDPDGAIVKWTWSKISGPAAGNIVSPSDSSTLVKALTEGVYLFELKVTDNRNLSSKDTLQVIVKAIQNLPPVARAGNDTTIYLPNNLTLDGSGSTDPENDIVSYQWNKISGPDPISISDLNAKQTSVTTAIPGSYQFELIVIDGGGESSKDTVQIEVLALDSLCGRANIPAKLLPIATLSTARSGIKTAAAGNKILFAGGLSGGNSYSTRVDIYDISTNTFTTAELSEGRTSMAVATLGNKIFFAGGFTKDFTNSSRVDIYDVSTNKWSVAELSTPRYAIAAAAAGNKVLFAGGALMTNGNYSGESTTVDIYDNNTNTWSVDHLSVPKAFFTASTLADKIYFAGGYVGGGAFPDITSQIEIYDATTNTWKNDQLKDPRFNQASVAVGSRVFWAGGITNGSNVPKVEIMDVNTGERSFHCLISKMDFSAVVKGENFVFFTGWSTSGNRDHIYDKFDIFNNATNKWYTGVIDQKILSAAIISVNNVIYVAGGTDGNKTYNQLWKLEF